MVNDDDRPNDDDNADAGFSAASSDLSAALGDLLAGGIEGDNDSSTSLDTGHESPSMPSGDDLDMGELDMGELDLGALEDAVAELGLDVGDANASEIGTDDDGPLMFQVGDEPEPALAPEARPNLGLDLTELPPPGTDGAAQSLADLPAPGGVASGLAAAGERSLPPLGEATADDLFGPIEDDPGLPSSWHEETSAQDGPEAMSSADMSDIAAGEGATSDPVQLPAPEPAPLATPDPGMADVVGFTAHGGTITGNIRDKAKKLFGR